MDKELKKDIKKLLLVDSILTSSSSISKILDEVEDELEELFGKTQKNDFNIEELFNIHRKD
jgi:hypothetical protein